MYGELDDNIPQSEDLFKKKFKYYKANHAKRSFSDLLSDCTTDKVIPIKFESVFDDPRTELLGLKKCSVWTSFTFRDHPGLLLIRNPFTGAGQRYWIRICLEVYSRKPNKRNLDSEIDVHDWWKECFQNRECNRQLQKKLRWTTLGYHHNWDNKIYSEENRTSFPNDLAELSDVVAQYIGYTNFKAEAAIVNYYHMDSTLSGHTDHSELNLEAPLFSFSFGQSAIFLIGGKDKSMEPSALLLNSGDIVIMSKEARLCFHAVPKILPATYCPWRETYVKDEHTFKIQNIDQVKYLKDPKDILYLMNSNFDNAEWDPFNTYIEESRINMNVRQVLNENQNSLKSV